MKKIKATIEIEIEGKKCVVFVWLKKCDLLRLSGFFIQILFFQNH